MKLQWFFILLSAFGFSQNASIDFEIRNLGVNVDGHFNTFTITTSFDNSGKLENINGKITVKSIRTGIESRDEHLLKEDYFYIEKHPTITLKSTKTTKQSDGKYSVNADLTIKGKTKSITFPVTVKKLEKKFQITSAFEINRRDFNVGGGSFVMSKTVKLNVVHYQKL